MSGQIEAATCTAFARGALVISQYQYGHVTAACQFYGFLYGLLFAGRQGVAHQFVFGPTRVYDIDTFDVIDFYIIMLIDTFESVDYTIKTFEAHRTIMCWNVIFRVGIGTDDGNLAVSGLEGKHVISILQQYEAFTRSPQCGIQVIFA